MLPHQHIANAHDTSKEEVRAYLGASIVGNPCGAYLAFSLRGFPNNQPDKQLKRIFALGHVIEDIVIADLRKSGLDVIDRDQTTGRQIAYQLYGGHVKMHMDGQIVEDGGLALLEIKSMGDSKFKEFQSKGIRNSHRIYYDQMQLMMGASGIQHAYLVAYNKNNSDYHSERVKFDEFYFAQQQYRIEKVLANEAEKIATDETDWRCRGCFKFDACWRGDRPEADCRNCGHAIAMPDGKWFCRHHKRDATEACEAHAFYAPLEKSA